MRARTLKASFFVNEDVATLKPLARILFQGLWCMADREGRLENRPMRIKAAVLPFDNVDANQLLGDIESAGLIMFYEADGKKLIQIPSFAKHQKVHPKEQASELPAPRTAKSRGKQPTTRGKQPDSRGEQPPKQPLSSLSSLSSFPSESSSSSLDKHLSADADSHTTLDVESLRALWNELAVPAGLPAWDADAEKRVAPARARLKKHPDRNYWRAVISRIAASSFCRGGGKDGWVASADFLVQPDAAVKVLEGKYDDRARAPPPRRDGYQTAPPEKPRRTIEELLAEGAKEWTNG